MMVERQAQILEYAASVAWKYEETFGIGATFEWITVPQLDYSLIIDGTPSARPDNPVTSPLDILATTRGSSKFTPNAIVGTWFRPTRSLQFGAAGQVIPTQIVTHSRLTVQPLSDQLGAVTLSRPSTGERNANDVTVTLPLPLMARLGGRYRYFDGDRELFDVELDVEYETWSRTDSFTVATNGLRANVAGSNIDINDIIIPKHWQNTLSVKAGGDVTVVPDRLVTRGGVFYETAVAPNAYANVDFPGGAMMGVGLGASLLLGRVELAVGYQMRYMRDVSVSESSGGVYQQVPSSQCVAPYNDTTKCNANLMGRPAPVVNGGIYQAVSHFLSLGLLLHFGT
jgi:long-subunit fatty acid transport protein